MNADDREPGAGPREIAHAAVRGAVAGMAMTGMRTFTVHVGLAEESPPRAIFRQRARGVLKLVPRRQRRAVIELAHWVYGAGGGTVFGVLPDGIRRRAWAGPIYGLMVWLGYELGIAPALGLTHAKRVRPVERAAFAADHLLYGFVLSEMRRRPREDGHGG
jgi:hypothetical protein